MSEDPAGAVQSGGAPKPEEERCFPCDDCSQPFKTAQGLAGHRRLAHSTSTRAELYGLKAALEGQQRALKEKEAAYTRAAQETRNREVEVARREVEIKSIGPGTLGFERCNDCSGWFVAGELAAHQRALHPIDGKVASEAEVGRERVNDVWTEACYKQARHPKETPGQIVRRFWDAKDREILERLLAHRAEFRFQEE